MTSQPFTGILWFVNLKLAERIAAIDNIIETQKLQQTKAVHRTALILIKHNKGLTNLLRRFTTINGNNLLCVQDKLQLGAS